jgi:hypothetical protein
MIMQEWQKKSRKKWDPIKESRKNVLKNVKLLWVNFWKN